MQRFGNLKVGSVFSFLHPERAVSVSVLYLKNIYIYCFLNLKFKLRFGFWFRFGSETRVSVPTILMCLLQHSAYAVHLARVYDIILQLHLLFCFTDHCFLVCTYLPLPVILFCFLRLSSSLPIKFYLSI